MFGIHGDKEVIYQGTKPEVEQQFKKDKKKHASKNYMPISETWEEGRWGLGNFFVALLLCIILIGLIVFIYMAIVKPKGTLTVIYSYKKNDETSITQENEVKECPMCAENIKKAAKVCRYCGHEFTK